MYELIQGDCIESMKRLEAGSIQCCVTSPPYFGLRDYVTATWEGGDAECDHVWRDMQVAGMDGSTQNSQREGRRPPPNILYKDLCGKCGARRIDNQIGLEATPEEYVSRLVDVFREVKRVLRDDGTLWLNLGDSYAATSKGTGGKTSSTLNAKRDENGDLASDRKSQPWMDKPITFDLDACGLKPKDLIGIPWMVAFALRADGWYLRSDIIWHKPNPMPESVTDRPTKAHEYIFLLSKSARYYYDADAIREPNSETSHTGGQYRNGWKYAAIGHGSPTSQMSVGVPIPRNGRNRRSVWTVTTKPFSGTKLMTDYVGDDGKPYIASPDCPIHGHLARSRKSYTVGYGEQPDQPLHHNHSNGADHDPLHVVSQDAMTSRNHSDADAESVRPQTLGSIDDCKSGVDHLEHTSGAQSLSRTSHTSESHDGQDCKTDSVDPSCSPIASDHSTQMSRTDHVRPTLRHGNASVQTDNHTQNIPLFEGLFDSVDHRHENNTSVSDSSDIQATQTDSRNVGIETASASFVAFVTSTKNYTCTCQECKIDHFATFPPDLIEPCILAGSKAGDTVLDPFNGSGTTGAVSLKHHRQYIGIDLNPDYLELAHSRITQAQPLLLEVL